MYDPEIIAMAQIQVLGSPKTLQEWGLQDSASVWGSRGCYLGSRLSVVSLHLLTLSRVSLHPGPKTLPPTGTDVTQPRGLIQKEGWG